MVDYLNSKTLLIVDDEPSNLRVLGELLIDSDVKVAKNGEKALTIAKNDSPDLILLDIIMPGMNGFEVCQKLKNNKETKEIPIIFISALEETEQKLKGFKAGGVDYITKPFNSEEVLARVKMQLELSETKQELVEEKKRSEMLYKDLEAKFEKASQLHQQFLPTDPPQVEGISYNAFFQPSEKLGGDFYDIIRSKDKLLFYLSDITGHGLDGAMLNIFLRETINHYLLDVKNDISELEPGKLITHVADKYRKENFPADYFICLLVGVLDTKKMEVSFANAGIQFPPMKLDYKGELSVLNCSGTPISPVVSQTIFKDMYLTDYQEKITLKKGETIFLTTDGLLEELVGYEMYGEDRLKKVLTNSYDLPAHFINNKVKKDFKKFSKSLTGQDDLNFLTLKRNLKIIDRYEKVIVSNMEEMYKVLESVSEFIQSYYEMADLICIGLQEVLTNAIEHGNSMDTNKQVEIELEVTKKDIRITVTDEGEGFDWENKIEEKLDLENDDIKDDRGRGIKITKNLYDEICYNQKGNKAYLFKFRTKLNLLE